MLYPYSTSLPFSTASTVEKSPIFLNSPNKVYHSKTRNNRPDKLKVNHLLHEKLANDVEKKVTVHWKMHCKQMNLYLHRGTEKDFRTKGMNANEHTWERA